MLQAIGAILPIALAMALSSVPFLATIVLLLSEKHSQTAIPYLISYVVGVFVVAAVLSAGLASLPRRATRGDTIAIVEIVLGLALIALGIVQWIRHRDAEPASTSGWLQRVSTFGVVPAVGFALLMNIRPKALLLATAAGLAIGTADLHDGEWVTCVVIYTVIASVTVTIPVILTLLRPRQMSKDLLRMQSWILRKSGVITVIVLLMVGTGVFGAGLADL